MKKNKMKSKNKGKKRSRREEERQIWLSHIEIGIYTSGQPAIRKEIELRAVDDDNNHDDDIEK